MSLAALSWIAVTYTLAGIGLCAFIGFPIVYAFGELRGQRRVLRDIGDGYEKMREASIERENELHDLIKMCLEEEDDEAGRRPN